MEKVRDAYRATLALEPPPTVQHGCPLDLGTVYHLVFSGGGAPLMRADVSAMGCQFVRATDGSVTAELWAVNPDYWSELAQDLGVARSAFPW